MDLIGVDPDRTVGDALDSRVKKLRQLATGGYPRPRGDEVEPDAFHEPRMGRNKGDGFPLAGEPIRGQ